MQNDSETELRTAMADWLEGVRTGDVERVMKHYAEDVETFNLAPPLVYKGNQAVKETLVMWLGSYEGPVGYEQRDLKLHVSGDVAFCHSLNHVQGKLKTGDPVSMWFRVTVGLERRNGQWLTVHEHVSDPIDMQTRQALFDLVP